MAGLFSVALVVTRFFAKSNSRTLSGSLPFGVRTFLLNFSIKAIARLAPMQGSNILAKNVQQIKFGFIVCKFVKSVGDFDSISGTQNRVGLFAVFDGIQIEFYR